MNNLDALKQQGDVIWNIANLLRGPYRPPQYRRVMIPLTVLRRLDCMLEGSKDKVLAHYKKLKAEGKDEETIEKVIAHKFGLPIFNISEFTFQKLLGDPEKLAANLRNFMAGFSGRARRIIEKFKFDEEIEKLEDANRLFEVVKEIAAVDLHPEKIPNIAMGYVFEDLVRRFNEQANEEAGDHFTPREVIKLMVKLLFTHDDLVYKPAKVIKIYDPTCGTGGMLSESEKLIADPDSGLNPGANVQLFGQEYNPESYAICGSDLMIKGEGVENIVFGDTLGTGKAKEGFADGDGHPNERFHYMLANPPFGVEWKPEKGQRHPRAQRVRLQGPLRPRPAAHQRRRPAVPAAHDVQDAARARGWRRGLAHRHRLQRLAAVHRRRRQRREQHPPLDHRARHARSRDRPARPAFLQHRHQHLRLDRHQPQATHRRGKVQLINATEFAWKMKKSLGDKRKRIGDGSDGAPDHIAVLTRLYGDFQHDVRQTLGEIRTNIDPKRDQAKSLFVSKIFDNQDFGFLKITVERPLRLNFAVNDERIARVQPTGAFTELAISRKRKDKGKIAEEVLGGQEPRKPPSSMCWTA